MNQRFGKRPQGNPEDTLQIKGHALTYRFKLAMITAISLVAVAVSSVVLSNLNKPPEQLVEALFRGGPTAAREIETQPPFRSVSDARRIPNAASTSGVAPATIRELAKRDILDPGAICFDRAEAIDPGYKSVRLSMKGEESYASASRYRHDDAMECLLISNAARLCQSAIKSELLKELESYLEGSRFGAKLAEENLQMWRMTEGLSFSNGSDSNAESWQAKDHKLIMARATELSRGPSANVLQAVEKLVQSGRLVRADFSGFWGLGSVDPAIDGIFSRIGRRERSCA